MNVSIICNDSAYFLRHRRYIADALVREGVKVSVIAGGNLLPSGLKYGWEFRRVPIERFSFSPILDMRLAIMSLVEFLHRSPAAVYLVTLKPAVFSGVAAIIARAILRRPMPIVVTIPGLGRLMGPNSAMKEKRHFLSRYFVKRVIRWLSSQSHVHFVFETQADRSIWLADGMVREDNSVQVAGAGVDPTLYYPVSPRRIGTPVRVLFASRLLLSKGLDVFLQVARSMRSDSAFHFIVAGWVEPSDPDGVALEQLAGDPSIEFLGSIEDMPSLLRSVDLVCLPTRYGEGIPRILIEAAACGLPCIATDLDGCRQIVAHGVSGYIISNSARSIEAGMEKALQVYRDHPQLLLTHGSAARDRFLSDGFSQENVIDRYLELLVGEQLKGRQKESA